MYSNCMLATDCIIVQWLKVMTMRSSDFSHVKSVVYFEAFQIMDAHLLITSLSIVI